MAWKYKARPDSAVHKRAEQSGGNFIGYLRDDVKTFKPAAGSNWVRIFPATWEEPEHWGYDVHIHSSIGPDNATVLCPQKMKGSPCPICEDRVKAERQGEDQKIIDALKPKHRVLAWITDKNSKDDPAPLIIWSMGWTTDKDINKQCRDKTTGEVYYIDDPDEGYDLYFDREGEKRNTRYGGFQVARKQSQVHSKDLKYVIENPIPVILIHRSYEELKAVYAGAKDDEPRRQARPDADEREPSPRRSEGRERGEADEAPRGRPRDEEEAPARRGRDADREEEPRSRRSSRDDDEREPSPHRRETEEAPQRGRRDDPPEHAPREDVSPRARKEASIDDEIPDKRWEEERAERRRDTSSEDRDRINRDVPMGKREEPLEGASPRERGFPREPGEKDAEPRSRRSRPDDDEPPARRGEEKREVPEHRGSGGSRADSLKERFAKGRE